MENDRVRKFFETVSQEDPDKQWTEDEIWEAFVCTLFVPRDEAEIWLSMFLTRAKYPMKTCELHDKYVEFCNETRRKIRARF
ncbi:hypothetical protein TVAG_201820 [Trichomonas vaginalis G3]|uniref:Uncharacterized protein n=1 Tax=Trichomonas vaginalis (strain ATCC PRA-98 / G3) TaxID=412133 RepID=A2DWK3_TRIV3|nr:hypothetical protein TVAGG3_0202020 [Trichomonas vaginalis G3]EAY15188.1 hypothetical protein TVAG_201820 [Trichomonas vaginalis G3]KAI5550657.1 hypothetical protein TVAGG3_0202020 [Trichomonas vaginalis G3]|eukprot:XP_001327411.1 hypothetical protein [Trichomonas vaginalis G3]